MKCEIFRRCWYFFFFCGAVKILDILESLLDSAAVSFGELFKSLFQEIWRLVFRILVFFATVFIGLLYKPSFDRWLKEERGRIRTHLTDEPMFGLRCKPCSRYQQNGREDKLKRKSSRSLDGGVCFVSEKGLPGDTERESECRGVVGDQMRSSELHTESRGRQYGSDVNIMPNFDDYLLHLLRHENVKGKKIASRLLKASKSKKYLSRNIFASEKVNTGFLEDVRAFVLLSIDSLVEGFRRVAHDSIGWCKRPSLKGLRFFSLRRVFGQWSAAILVFTADPLVSFKRVLYGDMLNDRHQARLRSAVKKLIEDQGYVYESYDTVTNDGYILKMERLARRDSRRVLYFQHGLMDSSLAWFGQLEGETASALAFRAYDEGYDIFVGIFRGCEEALNHVDPNIKPRDYWDFSINDHGSEDIAAFIRKIVEIKQSELKNDKMKSDSESFQITIIAHSMGAMAALIYLIWSEIKKMPHRVSSAILLSPAGYHKSVSFTVYALGILVYSFKHFSPSIHVIRIPGRWFKVLCGKIFQDIKNSFSGRIILSWVVSRFLGGSVDDHAIVNCSLNYNVYSGTSFGVVRHFLQLCKSQKFQGYDYGTCKNMQVYHSPKPIDFMDNYDKMDIPICFITGLDDTLIPPVNTVMHYTKYNEVRPGKAFFKAFSHLGHVDFTLRADEDLISFILATLRKLNAEPSEVDVLVGKKG